jgi:hypothetical protein
MTSENLESRGRRQAENEERSERAGFPSRVVKFRAGKAVRRIITSCHQNPAIV